MGNSETKPGLKCYIYTRVSTLMQVDGYSLDAQQDKLTKYADYRGMEVVRTYSDQGKSGKSVEGRPEFQRMMSDIADGRDGVSFVLVYKLSRFGRNAADVLSSLQMMQDYGVNLICVEDSIDSSKDAGKLMISVLSAVAEIERENILVQTMEGRRQKAREGRWNGGPPPYGYKLVDGELVIEEAEAVAIRAIYDKFIHTNMGVRKIAEWMNTHGYEKIKRGNNTLDTFTVAFVTNALDNQVYCGKMPYGRRTQEKVSGTRNEYHVVKADDFMLNEGIHEAIISPADWQLAHQKRLTNGKHWEKTHSLEHEHVLSAILRCPICGGAMYGNVNRKKKNPGDKESYRDYFYYVCKHRAHVDGHACDYRKQWGQDVIDGAVAEVLRKLARNEKFADAVKEKIGSELDTAELDRELETQRKRLRQAQGTRERLIEQENNLSYDDPYYKYRLEDIKTAQNMNYDEIAAAAEALEMAELRLTNLRNQKITEDNVYLYLLYFDKLYDHLSDKDKKELMNSLITRIEIFPEQQPDGRILRSIEFRFPVFYEGEEVVDLRWDSDISVSTAL